MGEGYTALPGPTPAPQTHRGQLSPRDTKGTQKQGRLSWAVGTDLPQAPWDPWGVSGRKRLWSPGYPASRWPLRSEPPGWA